MVVGFPCSAPGCHINDSSYRLQEASHPKSLKGSAQGNRGQTKARWWSLALLGCAGKLWTEWALIIRKHRTFGSLDFLGWKGSSDKEKERLQSKQKESPAWHSRPRTMVRSVALCQLGISNQAPLLSVFFLIFEKQNPAAAADTLYVHQRTFLLCLQGR